MKRLGPVLQFLGCQNLHWGVSALVVTDAADAAPQLKLLNPSVAISAQTATVPGATAQASFTAWRFDFAIAQSTQAQTIQYELDGQVFSITVPAKDSMPSIAYASCNGFSSLSAMKQVEKPNELWARVNRLHDLTDNVDGQTFGPFNLLLMGGDQIYSDALWAVIPELKAWAESSWGQRITAPFTASMQAQLQTYFSKIYMDRWSQADVSSTLATLPCVMMWDDHDIMDGWGSHPIELHDSPVFQGIFQVAKAAFEFFQRQMMGTAAPAPATLPGQNFYNSGYRFGSAGLLVLDMRSERRPRSGDLAAVGGMLNVEQVLSQDSWHAVYNWLTAQETAGDMKHLFVMSSIPVVHPSFETLEKLLGIFPGQQELEDDLRDHWTSPPHKAERLRLIHRLLQASAAGIRVTILSGDVHVAALGVIESDRTDLPPTARVINQLTSSGIVHPPPAGVALFFLEQACQTVEKVDRGITCTMYEFPTTSHRMIGCRNFLTLQPDSTAAIQTNKTTRYWANWWAEAEPHPYTKVIHEVTRV